MAPCAVSLFIALGATSPLSGCGRDGGAEAVSLEPVKVLVPADEGTIRGRLVALFSASAASRPAPFDNFILLDRHAPAFPPDEHLSRSAPADPLLRRYLSLPPALRANDLCVVEPRGDLYWTSEVRYRGRLVPFRAQFLLHLESVAGGTEVEVLEYFPEMRVGRKLGLGAHGPGLFDDIRRAPPTNRDRQQLRALVERSVLDSVPAPTR